MLLLHPLQRRDCHDEEGTELPNSAVAMQRAIIGAREMAAQSVREGYLVLSHRIEVQTDTGQIIGIVHFRDVVTIRD